MTSSHLSPADVSEKLFERCLRALYHAPEHKPTFELLLDMHGQPEGLKAAIAVAYAAGRESLLHEPNDIEVTGRCCCNGCIGEGWCDVYEPADADERAENDAERIAEMTPEERDRWGEL